MECRYDRLNLLVSQRIKALEETRNHEDNVFKDQMLLLLDKKANELSDISLPEMVDAGRSDFILHVNNMLTEEFVSFVLLNIFPALMNNGILMKNIESFRCNSRSPAGTEHGR